MNLVTALAFVVGILGGVLTWVVLGPVTGHLGLSLWAAFIAWASFFHCGGGESGFMKSVIAGLWGAVMATVALVAIPMLASLNEYAAPVAVGATVLVMILGAHIPALSAIPAAVYGYAATAAYALMKTGADPLGMDLATSPLLNIGASMILGAVFGYVSDKIAGAMAAP